MFFPPRTQAALASRARSERSILHSKAVRLERESATPSTLRIAVLIAFAAIFEGVIVALVR
jgi:hypothetical protein